MLKDQGSTLRLKTCTSWARVCDTCRSAPCTIYCRADAAYLCTACDARVHAAGKLAFRHERVWVCESCEQAPAAFICKADAASLCPACDADVHAANPLARRHHRVPVAPIPGALYGPQPGATVALGVESPNGFSSDREEDEDEAASWLLFDAPVKNGQHDGGEGGVDEFLDLVEFGGGGDEERQQGFGAAGKVYGGEADRVVPVRREVEDGEMRGRSFEAQASEYESLHGAGYGSHATLTHSVSMSSLDVGVVPDSTRNEVSNTHPRPSKGTIDLFSNPPIQMPTQLNPMDREARVLRYREKKKNRKFEKTIRYASRKAYAETRPRIKGRFAKRTNVDVEVDRIFSTTLMMDAGYGVVPSF